MGTLMPALTPPPWLPPSTERPLTSPKNWVKPSSGWLLMYRTVPDSDPEP